jgi:hypothetical protein
MSCALRTPGSDNGADFCDCDPPTSEETTLVKFLESVFPSLGLSTRLDVGAKAKKAGSVPAWSPSAFEALDASRTQVPSVIAHIS